MEEAVEQGAVIQKEIAKNFINSKDAMTMMDINQFKGHTGGAFHGIFVTTRGLGLSFCVSFLHNSLMNVLQKIFTDYYEEIKYTLLLDNDGNVILTEGLVLQDRTIWEKFTGREVIPKNHSSELYFTTINTFFNLI